MDYDDILNRTWDEIPEPKLLPGGGWALKGGNLDLTAILCYKGDSAGVQSRNDCSEDMADPTMNLRWDGRNISISTDSTTLVFHKLENAMAAKAD